MQKRTACVGSLLMGIWLAAGPYAAAQSPVTESAARLKDGQHDWDMLFGTWKMHLRKLMHPLTGASDWVDFESHDSTRGLLGGRANLDELEADSPAGHIEGLTVRLYNPHSHEWSIYWANSADPDIGPAMVGGYQHGCGEFFDQEIYKGRSIYVRFLWTNVSRSSGDFEQAFSVDGGKSWEPNWITTMAREPAGQARVAPNPDRHDGQHDFDFESGRWKVQLKRLTSAAGSPQEWAHYSGTIDVNPVWNGRANIAELDAKNGGDEVAGVSVRLFDPRTRQWSMWWGNLADGKLDSAPVVGGFANGRGEFYGFQKVSDRWVMVRFVFSGIGTAWIHGEQAFSTDGGKTWAPNWIEDLTREASKP